MSGGFLMPTHMLDILYSADSPLMVCRLSNIYVQCKFRMLINLNNCAVDSMNPNDCHSQHPPRTPVPHHSSQLLQTHPRSPSTSSTHLTFGRPFLLLLLLPSTNANVTSVSSPVRPHHVPENHHLMSCGSL